MGNQQSHTGGDLSFDLSSPATPFTQPTGPDGLKIGKIMFIEGEALSYGKKDHFQINFDADDKQRDVVFHYDVRFWKDDRTIVMNSKLGKWQGEERVQNNFQQKQPFRIDVQIAPEGFIISTDKGLPYTFRYRIKPDKVAQIKIEGQVKINRIFYGYPPTSSPLKHDAIQSPPNPTYQAPPSVTSGSMYGGSIASTPSSDGYSAPGFTGGLAAHPVYGGMYIGRQIVISGTPSGQFNIDLNGQPGNIALHISVRFNENAVVRNSLRANHWEHEERQGGHFPFVRNQPFQMQILCDHSGYKIAINGQHYADFFHRIEASTVQSVATAGDLSGATVQIF
uniref:Galectin n=1 Tax=Plectus sambesii TaxID=2011161 RepID=A0A914W9K6_9BILA